MPALAALLAALGPWISRFFMAKGAMMFAGFLGRLGIVIGTNELAMEPLTNLVVSKWATMPASMQCWLALFGVTKAVSIMLSAMTLISAKKLFFSKAD
ncbi:MAG: DUF2523 family protein [Thermomonas sp.]|uniref:DUF2523 family protein n=1 Tax=Thermomonas sp. TaxID=1971895 RepID=UPI0039E334B8